MTEARWQAREIDVSLWPAVAFGLSVAVGNGLGRFAYALLLPAMQQDLGMNYAQSGWLNTANALGYVMGAVSSFVLLGRHTPRSLFMAGLVLCTVSIGLTGLDRSLAWLTAMRVVSGVGAAWMFSCGSVLVQQIYAANDQARGVATGLYFGGAGLGIVASGLVVGPTLGELGPSGWPIAWGALGFLAAVAGAWPLHAAWRLPSGTLSKAGAEPLRLASRGLIPSLMAYTCFAAGYIGYMTFVFAWLREQEHSAAIGVVTWTILGLCVLVSPWVWRRALTSWSGAVTLSASSLLTLAGVVVALSSDSIAAALLSASCFGLGMFIAPASVAILLRQRLPAGAVARGMALFTTLFSLGQAVGPILSGWLADLNGLGATLWPGVVLLALAVALPRVRGSSR